MTAGLSGCTGSSLELDPTLGMAATPPSPVGIANAESEPTTFAASAETAPATSTVPVPEKAVSEIASEATDPAPTDVAANAPAPATDSTPEPAIVPPAPIAAAAPVPTVPSLASADTSPAPVPPLALAESKPKRSNVFALLQSRASASERRKRSRVVKVRERAKPTSASPSTREAGRIAKRSRSVTVIKPRRGSGGALPGVRAKASLFGIRREENDSAKSFRVASAAGLARRSSNGFIKQTASVETACFKPRLVAALKRVERHFGRPVIVTSGYRSPKRNARAGGAKGSKHISCEAADIQIEGVSRSKIAAFLRGMPDRGGVGTYCHTKSVHYDIGSQRDWSWGCRKRRRR